MKKILIFAAVAIALVLIYNSYRKRKAAALEASIAAEDAAKQVTLVADLEEKSPFLTDYDKFIKGFENLGVSYDVES